MSWLRTLSVVSILSACAADAAPPEPHDGPGGKADGLGRQYEVLMTNPHCDVCTGSDKAALQERSEIVSRIVEAIDAANPNSPIRIAQFTFSVRQIEDALVRAHERHVPIQVAMDAGQDRDGSLARRLVDAGLDVRFVAGNGNGSYNGLQHAKFMLIGETTLFTGSNNWSSTGTSINEENTLLVRSTENDPLIDGFQCHFDAMWNNAPDSASACSDGEMSFGPGSGSFRMIRSALRSAEREISVLMHHLTFSDLVKELAKAAERGVRVRVVVNAADREEHQGTYWDRIIAAGGEIRYKQSNADLYQLMHHKYAIVDDSVVNGSGNWSGSGFFNNYENYIRYYDEGVVSSFSATFERIWDWSLTADSLDSGGTAATQHASSNRVFFGNLHAHYAANVGEQLLDDGKLELSDGEGGRMPVQAPEDTARYAFEYARDRGGMDFLALTPHCSDEADSDQPNQANMSQARFEALLETAEAVTAESQDGFLAMAGMEWSTNSAGNHLNILGTREIAKVERGAFDELYERFLPDRLAQGETPIVMMNHPRTFSAHEATDEGPNLNGTWDQIFGVNLQEISNNSQRDKKFNDYGIDDFPPLRDVRDEWLSGAMIPDEATVEETLRNLWAASSPYTRLMEVTLGRGNEFDTEVPQNPSLSYNMETEAYERRTKVHTDMDYYLVNGFEIAPVASHDNHFPNWGTAHTSRTAVIAPALSEASLLRALEQRAVFASEDENLEVRFYADSRVFMGGSMATTNREVAGQLQLVDPDYQGSYEVVVYHGVVGGSVEALPATTLEADGWIELMLPTTETGRHFFYVEVLEQGADRMAWSAPIWIDRW